MKMSICSILLLIVITAFVGLSGPKFAEDIPYEKGPNFSSDACTDIVVGKMASKDGSVITSHTGCCPECRVHVVPAQTFQKGEKAPVYYGLQDVNKPLHEYGKIIGYIHQVEKTYKYFHTGYPHINEYQLAIAESTLSQREELKVDINTGKQIMTIEQAMLFALQRCQKAREAIELITSLVEKYGFLPSCGPESEALCVADPEEAWILEVFSVGPDWSPENGKLGAIWAAQRVPDDHVAIVPNWSVIKEIDLSKPDYFMASSNYIQVAIERGWYDPESGKPFIWQEAYSPTPREWAVSRFWLFFNTFAPYHAEWPDKTLTSPFKGYDAYHQYLEPLSIYPFSVKPEKKLSVQDVIAFQRSVFEGTIYDMTADSDWFVLNGQGGMKRSPLTTPFPTSDMRELLDITWRRMVSRGGYGMVAQLRGWLPAAIGGIYWFYLDNQHVSTYVPIYAGVQKISPLYKTYDPDRFSEDSARWAIDFVDNLLYLRWQHAIKDLRAVRDPLEAEFFGKMAEIDSKTLKLFEKNPKLAENFLTEYTKSNMEKVVNMYRELRSLLITKYTNNKMGL
ncbi:MAG: C69 family dipeptidase [Candidatus Aminicenantes bacterium]|nr:C69 family dipeptidase [Candidatus Aminicenantes bacterium]MDH5384393.1 C69 family dipeptidase [Candidatus Aminicenantes bacterium]MDH5744335.1 C69 family dipeptidase [Candidatus Aminicenantes bacterium]